MSAGGAGGILRSQTQGLRVDTRRVALALSPTLSSSIAPSNPERMQDQ